jgi:hypothetical protein
MSDRSAVVKGGPSAERPSDVEPELLEDFSPLCDLVERRPLFTFRSVVHRIGRRVPSLGLRRHVVRESREGSSASPVRIAARNASSASS